MLNPESRAKPSRVVDPGRTVRRDPLIDRDPDQFDVASVPEELRQECRGRARVLPAAHADGDSLSAAKVDLGSELALHAPLHELEKVIAAQVVPTVADPFHRRLSAPIARHDRSKRRGGLRPHGPGGDPGGGAADGGGGPACAAPSGGATAGPGMYGGAAPKDGGGGGTNKAYATAPGVTGHETTNALINAQDSTATNAAADGPHA